PPMRPAVVTVGAIAGGEAHNIIPDEVRIKGTVRTLHAEVRDLAEAALARLCAGLSGMMRAEADFVYRRGVPPLVNDDTVLDAAVAAVRRQLGDVVAQGEPSLGGEDFALLAELVPSFQLRIGSGAPGRSDKLHNSAYQPDEACIGLGVQALARAAFDLMA
ncbi:MAG TPA: M20/M25/M40 family metallo-hydrolase, partial [Acetobacteraceae bacterium]|nr:M20/M25/M40 family metallo-hydrolase [Acetobacteraceae bacterium]